MSSPAPSSRPCRGCQTEIFFAVMPSGKTLPLEVAGKAVPEGGMWYAVVEDGEKLKGYPVKALYQAHWGKCPKAEEFRRKGR